jgi:flagellar hook-associated protein 3 FlgL
MRSTINKSQQEVLEVQQEITTGTYADAGVALGYQVGRSVNLTTEKAHLTSIMDSNSIVSQRLTASQSALENMSSNVQESLNTMIALSGTADTTQLSTATNTLQMQLEAFVSTGNTSANGEYLFAGTNTGEQPLSIYNETSAAKVTFDTELSNFMTTNGIGSMNDFTTDQMEDFLTNTIEPLYTGAQWNTDWSTASDTNMTTKVATSETVDTSTNSNEDGFRKFALASVIGIELLNSGLSATVTQYVSTKAISYLGESVAGIDQQRSDLGLAESRVNKADEALQVQIDTLTTAFNDLNEVDAYEASTRVNTLLTQMEASYQMTAKIQQLSLTNYL